MPLESPAPPGTEEFLRAMVEASFVVAICFGAALLAAKLGYYLGGAIVLRKPPIRSLFNDQIRGVE